MAPREGPGAKDLAPLLSAMLNMTEFHREHEKYHSTAPREQAVTLQRHSRTLHGLADRWKAAPAGRPPAFSPYEGAPDLTAPAALHLDGVLFMEGEGEPVELAHLRRDLRTSAEDAVSAGEWLATAMESSWEVAAVLLDIDELADLLGERRRIIANNLQGASMLSVAGSTLGRAVDLLDRVDFVPAALRADLAGPGASIGRVYSAAEMIDHAADLFSDFAGVVHDNERRWRVFRDRVQAVATTIARGDR